MMMNEVPPYAGRYPEVGERIELLAMPDDPDPIPAGTRGTVTRVVRGYPQGTATFGEIDVAWDNGRTLNLIPGVDRWRVLP